LSQRLARIVQHTDAERLSFTDLAAQLQSSA